MRGCLSFGYRHSQPIWTATTADMLLVVDEQTYNRVLQARLATEGIELKTWMQYMRPAEEAWERQCEAEQRLKCDLSLWQSVSGVEIHPLQSIEEPES